MALKAQALKSPHRSLTYHIQQAIKNYLREAHQQNAQAKFQNLLRCKGISKRSAFGDAVQYQRDLRKEWE